MWSLGNFLVLFKSEKIWQIVGNFYLNVSSAIVSGLGFE